MGEGTAVSPAPGHDGAREAAGGKLPDDKICILIQIASLVLMFAGLALRGADGAAPAAAFAAALVAALIASIWTRPAGALVEALRAQKLTLIGATGLLGVGVVGAVIWPAGFGGDALADFWHPVWTDLGLDARALSIAPFRSAEGAAALLAPTAAFLLGALAPRTRATRASFGLSLVILTIALAAFAIAVHLARPVGTGHRLSAFFVSPNSAATVFGVLGVLCAGHLSRAARHSAHKTAAIRLPRAVRGLTAVAAAPGAAAAFVLAMTCLALTGSRAGVPAAAAGLLTFAALLAASRLKGGRVSHASYWGLAVVAAGALAVIGVGARVALDRAGSADADFADRLAMWSAHWMAFLERPLLGHGLNTFREINAHIMTAATWDSLHVAGAAHNIFIQMLEETGVVGALLWTLMAVLPLSRTLRTALRAGPGSEGAAAALGALTVCVLHGMVDFGLQTPALAALLAYVFGLYSSAPEKRDQRRRSAPV